MHDISRISLPQKWRGSQAIAIVTDLAFPTQRLSKYTVHQIWTLLLNDRVLRLIHVISI
jgi:hypothetical protein